MTYFHVNCIYKDMKKLRHQIRQIFREYMFKNEINQVELAKRLDVENSVVSQIIHENFNLSIDKFEEYCDKLKIEIEIEIKIN